jgi:hypothetical protein
MTTRWYLFLPSARVNSAASRKLATSADVASQRQSSSALRLRKSITARLTSMRQ